MIKRFLIFLFLFSLLFSFSVSADYVSDGFKPNIDTDSSNQHVGEYIPPSYYCSVYVSGIVFSSEPLIEDGSYALVGDSKYSLSLSSIPTPQALYLNSTYLSTYNNLSSVGTIFNNQQLYFYFFNYTINNFSMSDITALYSNHVRGSDLNFSQGLANSILDDLVFPNSHNINTYFLIRQFSLENFNSLPVSSSYGYEYYISCGFMSNFLGTSMNLNNYSLNIMLDYSYSNENYTTVSSIYYNYQSNGFISIAPTSTYPVYLNSITVLFPNSTLFDTRYLVFSPTRYTKDNQKSLFDVDTPYFNCYLSYTVFDDSNDYFDTSLGNSTTPNIDYHDYQKPKTHWYDFGIDLYNMFIWIIFEFPLLSLVTKPLFILLSSTTSVVSNFAIPIIFGGGFFGSLFLLIFLVKFINYLKR